ncbi:MAG TPA: Smr/MutS family protein [Micropepsaceae bacterium]|nr:Smr/MutS family protein [Micropepsaceae bacterium]
MSPRHIIISPEDEALFRHAMRDATPLNKRQVAVTAASTRRRCFVPLPMRREIRFVETVAEAAPIRGHTEARLRRGRLEPEARIDLHGHSYDSAYRLLVAFLARSISEGKRLVLVITGKGGVLRNNLPLWLNGAELAGRVIGLREAHAKHGGAGAFYVALQKRRPSGQP